MSRVIAPIVLGALAAGPLVTIDAFAAATNANASGTQEQGPVEGEAAELGGEASQHDALRWSPTELGAFFDGVMSAHLRDHEIAGATLAIVHDGDLLFSKGYGYADVDDRVPVDPAGTMFRIGSVTKAFTWTAVLQLRDEGLLDLDADLNGYLDFRIPDTFDEPITLRHLMTHTPGFEDLAFGLFGLEVTADRGEWLRENIPRSPRCPPRHQIGRLAPSNTPATTDFCGALTPPSRSSSACSPRLA